jgi:hypothetical protein
MFRHPFIDASVSMDNHTPQIKSGVLTGEGYVLIYSREFRFALKRLNPPQRRNGFCAVSWSHVRRGVEARHLQPCEDPSDHPRAQA